MMGAIDFVEQRWSQRRDVSLGVDVCQQGVTLVLGKARDVGLGGVFIEVPEGQLLMNSDVDLLFHLGSQDAPSRHKLSARVVRQTRNGVGLAFRDFDTRAFRALQEIMRHAPAQ